MFFIIALEIESLLKDVLYQCKSRDVMDRILIALNKIEEIDVSEILNKKNPIDWV